MQPHRAAFHARERLHFCAKNNPEAKCPSGQSGPVLFCRSRISQVLIRLDVASLGKVIGPLGQGEGRGLFGAGPKLVSRSHPWRTEVDIALSGCSKSHHAATFSGLG
jgi:hypothetical protein